MVSISNDDVCDVKDCNNLASKRIEYDTGTSLAKKDIWNLCIFCSDKPEFQDHRICIKHLRVGSHV